MSLFDKMKITKNETTIDNPRLTGNVCNSIYKIKTNLSINLKTTNRNN